MKSPALRPRKVPRQARSQAMVDLILQAAARVLSQNALAGFNTNRVAEVAGISVGSLYQYFPNKDALMARLIEAEQSHLAESVERCAAAGVHQPLPEVLCGLIDIAVHHQFGRAAYAAALDHEERRLPLAAVIGQAQQRIVQAVQILFDSHADELPRALPPQAPFDCLVITKAMVEAAAGASMPDLEGLKQRVLRALWGYLMAGNVPSATPFNRDGA
jgi:AcrR family transcriptional regulator